MHVGHIDPTRVDDTHKKKVYCLDEALMDWRDRIDSDPNVIGGKLRIKGTRIGVAFPLELFSVGWTRERILENYPHLTATDLDAVFAFAAEATEDTLLVPPKRAAA